MKQKASGSTVMGPVSAVVPGVGVPSAFGGEPWWLWGLLGDGSALTEHFGVKAVVLRVPPPKSSPLGQPGWAESSPTCASVSLAGELWSGLVCAASKASLRSLSVWGLWP